MVDFSVAPDRRGFLGAATLGAVAGLAELAAATRPAAAAEDAAGPTEFTRWLDSIGGKQRQVFDAPEPNNGFPLLGAYVFLLTGTQAYAVPEKELGVVVVLRHNAIPIAFNDGLWSKYKLGEVFTLTDPASKSPATRNFFANSKPGDLPIPDAAVERLVARGVKVAVCNMAMKYYSGVVAKRMNVPPEEVHKEWSAGVLPGVQIVPSGVVAVNGAQSRGCTYCFAG